MKRRVWISNATSVLVCKSLADLKCNTRYEHLKWTFCWIFMHQNRRDSVDYSWWKMTTVFKLADKLPALVYLGWWLASGIFNMLSTFSDIWQESKAASSVNRLALLSSAFQCYLLAAKDPRRCRKECVLDPFVIVPTKLSMSARVNCLPKTYVQYFCWHSGYKSRVNLLREPRKHWKFYF